MHVVDDRQRQHRFPQSFPAIVSAIVVRDILQQLYTDTPRYIGIVVGVGNQDFIGNIAVAVDGLSQSLLLVSFPFLQRQVIPGCCRVTRAQYFQTQLCGFLDSVCHHSCVEPTVTLL